MSAQIDTSFIKKYPSKIFISPSYSYRNFSVQFRTDDLKSKNSFLYTPRSASAISGSFAYKALALSGGVGLPAGPYRNKYFAKTKALGFGFSFAKSQHVIGLSFSRFSGLTDVHTPLYYSGTPVSNPYFFRRDDIRSTLFDGSYSYVFFHKKYSYKAAFTFKEKQIKSFGSPILMSNFSYIKLGADYSFVPDQLKNDFSSFDNLRYIRSVDYGLAPGYAYTIAHNQVFLALAVFGGVKLQHNRFLKDANSEKKEHVFSITPLSNFKVNIGYNGNRYFGGLAYNSQNNFIRLGEVKGRLRNRYISVRIGMRLDPSDKVKKLEKRLYKYLERFDKEDK